MAIKHKFVSNKPDSEDTTLIRPSNWNDSHDVEGQIPIWNNNKTVLSNIVATNITATRNWTLPDKSMTIAGTDDISTHDVNTGVHGAGNNTLVHTGMIVEVVYSTNAPPNPDSYPEGTIFIRYKN